MLKLDERGRLRGRIGTGHGALVEKHLDAPPNTETNRGVVRTTLRDGQIDNTDFRFSLYFISSEILEDICYIENIVSQR